MLEKALFVVRLVAVKELMLAVLKSENETSDEGQFDGLMMGAPTDRAP